MHVQFTLWTKNKTFCIVLEHSSTKCNHNEETSCRSLTGAWAIFWYRFWQNCCWWNNLLTFNVRIKKRIWWIFVSDLDDYSIYVYLYSCTSKNPSLMVVVVVVCTMRLATLHTSALDFFFRNWGVSSNGRRKKCWTTRYVLVYLLVSFPPFFLCVFSFIINFRLI